MNNQLKDYARKALKEDLDKCTEEQQIIFKCIYSRHGNLGASINDVIDLMQEENLDWAMQQVKRTLEKNEKRKGQVQNQ